MSNIYYHFTGNKLRDGRPIPPAGEWLRHHGPVIVCKSGLHACAHPFDALNYAPGNLLHQVELRGITTKQDDKVVARERRILKSIDATELCREFACRCALDVAHLWSMPDVVREYLETRDETLRAAARDAAGAAAGDAGNAAWAAAMDAAGAAAWAAAGAAAWHAAWAAAWAAAGAAAWHAAWAAGDAARAGAKYQQWFLFAVNTQFSVINK